MQLTKEYLEQRRRDLLAAAEQHKVNAIANQGAADVVALLIKELSIEEINLEDVEVLEGKH